MENLIDGKPHGSDNIATNDHEQQYGSYNIENNTVISQVPLLTILASCMPLKLAMFSLCSRGAVAVHN